MARHGISLSRLAAIGALSVVTIIAIREPAVAQSGDATIDSAIATYARRAGSSGVPNFKPADYSNGVTACSGASPVPTWEQNCPSDLLYTPNGNTGGYQAFGVGINNVPGGAYWTQYCGYIPVEIGPGEYYWAWMCWWVPITLDDQTIGLAMARVTFGTQGVETPWGVRPMSTLAFKANNLYQPDSSSVTCQPDYIGDSAPCHPPNTYAVQNVGYEDKISIDDYGCTVPFTGRTGDSQDADRGCFVASSWDSDIPSAYLDTTKFDGAQLYIPSVGSSDPKGIAEGVTYYWDIQFYEMGLESSAPAEIVHSASVTTYLVVPGLGCANTPESIANCYFQVDQTRISPADIWVD